MSGLVLGLAPTLWWIRSGPGAFAGPLVGRAVSWSLWLQGLEVLEFVWPVGGWGCSSGCPGAGTCPVVGEAVSRVVLAHGCSLASGHWESWNWCQHTVEQSWGLTAGCRAPGHSGTSASTLVCKAWS